MSLFEPIFVALNEGAARYVVVGGLATVLHGHPRLTADVDLVVDLEPSEAKRAMEALAAVGLRPRAPVSATDFADPEQRRAWIETKGMRVFSLWDPHQPLREVDVFVSNPIAFADLWARSETFPLQSTNVRVASIADLIALKRLAGRAEDLQDVEALEAIAQERNGDG